MNRVVSLACLGILVAALVAAPRRALAGPKPTVAILGLELKDDGTGIDERSANIARTLTEALRKRAKAQTGPYILAPGGDKELVDAVLLASCASPDKECLATIGADMATDFLIYGRMEKSRDKGFQVSLTLMDVAKKDRVRQTTEVIPGAETGAVDLERWGKSIYGKLVGESTKGSLLLTANVDHGSVFVDDQPRGNLVQKQARIAGLDEGRHRVRIESDGWLTLDTVVVIVGGDTTEQSVTLFAGGGTDDGERPGGFWRKTAVVSGIVAAAAGGAIVFSWMKVKDYEQQLCSGRYQGDPGCMPVTTDPGRIEDIKSGGKLHQNLTYVEASVTIAAGGIFIYSLVKGFIAPGKREERLSIRPVLGPDVAGATLQWDW